MIRISGIVMLLALLPSAPVRADAFDSVKTQLAAAQCTSIKFLSVLHSSVFQSQDTSQGTAYLSHDGRYAITLDSDLYLCDGKTLYSYSPSSNQVIVQKVDSGPVTGKEVSFITRLDEFYESHILVLNREYRLTRRPGSGGSSIPDSMTVIIDSRKQRIVRIRYLDANDEQVEIIFVDQHRAEQCDDRRFVPHFPDSAETVKM